MVAYEFYIRDGSDGNRLVGILPERRINQGRISYESITNWAKTVFGNSFDHKDIFFTTINLFENHYGRYFSIEQK